MKKLDSYITEKLKINKNIINNSINNPIGVWDKYKKDDICLLVTELTNTAIGIDDCIVCNAAKIINVDKNDKTIETSAYYHFDGNGFTNETTKNKYKTDKQYLWYDASNNLADIKAVLVDKEDSQEIFKELIDKKEFDLSSLIDINSEKFTINKHNFDEIKEFFV